MINKETKLCISIAEYPGNIGATIHNAAYNLLNLNFIYLPMKPKDAESALSAVRNLNIKGCSVSMPFKQDVIKYLDKISDTAKRIGAVNTILNSNGVLKGFNTDYESVSWALKKLEINPYSKVLILGFGGMARACLAAVEDHFKQSPYIAVRNLVQKKYDNKYKFIDWKDRYKIKPELIINATQIGMQPNTLESPINLNKYNNLKFIIDVVSAPEITTLIKDAISKKIRYINGIDLAVHQACSQFELYTSCAAPYDFMKLETKKLSQK